MHATIEIWSCEGSVGVAKRLKAGRYVFRIPFSVIATSKMADQTERAFQKQPHLNLSRKSGQIKNVLRRHRNVGLGFKTPREAIDGTYIDKKCPFTGNVSIRGRILTGVVQKMKMQRTIVIRRDLLTYSLHGAGSFLSS